MAVVDAGQTDAPTGKRDPSYAVLFRVDRDKVERVVEALKGPVYEGDYQNSVIVLVDDLVKTSTREQAIERTRALLPEGLSFGDWATVLTEHVKWQTVGDPYARALDEMVATMMELNPELDGDDVRARARAALKRADQS